MAVHHGAMLVDVASPELARAALAVGETVALPVRLLGEVAAGELIASAEVGDRVAEWARVERLGPLGSAAAGPSICRIEGLRPWRERGSSRRLTPFVGRERELAALGELMAAAEAIAHYFGANARGLDHERRLQRHTIRILARELQRLDPNHADARAALELLGEPAAPPPV